MCMIFFFNYIPPNKHISNNESQGLWGKKKINVYNIASEKYLFSKPKFISLLIIFISFIALSLSAGSFFNALLLKSYFMLLSLVHRITEW